MPAASSGSLRAEHGASRDFVPYNLTVLSLRAVYVVTMALVENDGLEVRYANLNPANGEVWGGAGEVSTLQGSGLQEARGRPQTTRRMAGEQRTRFANLVDTVQTPSHVQRYSR